MLAQIKASVANIDYEKVEQMIRKQHDQFLRSLDPKKLPPGVSSIEEVKEQLEQGVAEQLKNMREQNARLGTPECEADQESGSEAVYSMIFDKSGDRLCLGTQNGIRVYRWDEVVKAQDDMPKPIMGVELGSKTMKTGKYSTEKEPYMYTLEHDEERDWVLFAGLEGLVRYLDLSSGCSGVLPRAAGRLADLASRAFDRPIGAGGAVPARFLLAEPQQAGHRGAVLELPGALPEDFVNAKSDFDNTAVRGCRSAA